MRSVIHVALLCMIVNLSGGKRPKAPKRKIGLRPGRAHLTSETDASRPKRADLRPGRTD